MALAFDILSCIFLATGSIFCVLGSLGVLRFPDLYVRTHATGLTDTLGVGAILLGLLLQVPTFGVGVKLVAIAIFLWITSPTATHALTQSAYAHGLEPTMSNDPKRPAPNPDIEP